MARRTTEDFSRDLMLVVADQLKNGISIGDIHVIDIWRVVGMGVIHVDIMGKSYGRSGIYQVSFRITPEDVSNEEDFFSLYPGEYRREYHQTKDSSPVYVKNCIDDHLDETIAMWKRKVRNAKRRKYRRGEKIYTVDEVLAQEFVFHHDKILAKGWFGSWQARMLQDAVRRGTIYKAIRKEDFVETDSDEADKSGEG